jgi:hypothetical protein
MIRPLVQGVLPALVGVGISLILVLATVFTMAVPVVILRAGTVETVPGYESTSGWYDSIPGLCSRHPCGNAGVTQFNFSVVSPMHLTGNLQATEPILVIVANPDAPLCGVFYYPPPPCLISRSPPYAFETPAAVTNIDLTALQFNFTGPNSELPVGSWTIYFLSWNVAPAEVTAVSSVVAAPE